MGAKISVLRGVLIIGLAALCIIFISNSFAHADEGPTFANPGNHYVRIGEENRIKFTIRSASPDLMLIIVPDKTTLPAGSGAEIDLNRKEFVWTPALDQAGDYTITIRAIDGAARIEQAFKVETVYVDDRLVSESEYEACAVSGDKAYFCGIPGEGYIEGSAPISVYDYNTRELVTILNIPDPKVSSPFDLDTNNMHVEGEKIYYLYKERRITSDDKIATDTWAYCFDQASGSNRKVFVPSVFPDYLGISQRYCDADKNTVVWSDKHSRKIYKKTGASRPVELYTYRSTYGVSIDDGVIICAQSVKQTLTANNNRYTNALSKYTPGGGIYGVHIYTDMFYASHDWLGATMVNPIVRKGRDGKKRIVFFANRLDRATGSITRRDISMLEMGRNNAAPEIIMRGVDTYHSDGLDFDGDNISWQNDDGSFDNLYYMNIHNRKVLKVGQAYTYFPCGKVNGKRVLYRNRRSEAGEEVGTHAVELYFKPSAGAVTPSRNLALDQVIKITGENFGSRHQDSCVLIDSSHQIDFDPDRDSWSDTEITCRMTVTGLDSGSHDLTVQTPGGATRAISITVLGNRAPVAGAIASSALVCKRGGSVEFTTAVSDPDGVYDIKESCLSLVGTGYNMEMGYDAVNKTLVLSDSAGLNKVQGFDTASFPIDYEDYSKIISFAIDPSSYTSGSKILKLKWGVTFKEGMPVGEYTMKLSAKDKSSLSTPAGSGCSPTPLRIEPEQNQPPVLKNLGVVPTRKPGRYIIRSVVYDRDGADDILLNIIRINMGGSFIVMGYRNSDGYVWVREGGNEVTFKVQELTEMKDIPMWGGKVKVRWCTEPDETQPPDNQPHFKHVRPLDNNRLAVLWIVEIDESLKDTPCNLFLRSKDKASHDSKWVSMQKGYRFK
ncbi:MAG: hypothetical protein ABH875_04020 [Candidatus Omnitrophota bacterium]